MEKLSQDRQDEFTVAYRSEDENVTTAGKADQSGEQLKPYVFGATVAGPLHIERGIVCQDAHACKALGEKMLAIAVADGLGSARRSDLGAKTAVSAAMRMLAGRLAAESEELSEEEAAHLVRATAQSARTALESLAGEEGDELRTFACTLIVILASEASVVVAHIGDGGVVAAMADGLKVVSSPGAAEYANEVVPLTSEHWESALRVSYCREDISCLAAFTDGCQRAALRRVAKVREESFAPISNAEDSRVSLCDGRNGEGLFERSEAPAAAPDEGEEYEAFAGFFDPLFSFAQTVDDSASGGAEIEGLLSGAKLSEHSEDDKTLVIAVFSKD